MFWYCVIYILIFFTLSSSSFAFFGKKKAKPILLLSSTNPQVNKISNKPLENSSVFKKNERIYFLVYTEQGFKSNYIKYQIIKQDDKAHIGGYSRIRNVTTRVKDKNTYVDYFVLKESGKYIIQIFDIENLQHWIALGEFRVQDE